MTEPSSFAARIEQAERAVLQSWHAFVEAEPEYARAELLAQVRTTLSRQDTKPAFDIQAFKINITKAIDSLIEEAVTAFRSVDDTHLYLGWRELGIDSALARADQVFGDAMVAAGFDSGDSPTHPGLKPKWHYYPQSSSVSTARRKTGLPLSPTLNRYNSAVEDLAREQAELLRAQASQNRQSNVDAWDAAD
jgi:hypothetical protein